VKIAVLVKRVPDTASVFEISADGKSVMTDQLKYVMSPYDEHAMEEAIKLKGTNDAEVIVVSAGGEGTKEVAIRQGLAMGADSGLLVTGDGIDGLTCKGISLALSAALKKISPDLIFAGKQAVDDDASQVPERIAELLGMAHVSVVTRLELGDGKVSVDREIEGGHYSLELPLPAVVTMEKGINTPRYPTLPNIMKAKKKPIEELNLSDLELSPDDLVAGISVEAMSLPRQDRLCKILEGESAGRVEALVKILREEEKVL
jgi:electron transfer flavoprotein beta subunit